MHFSLSTIALAAAMAMPPSFASTAAAHDPQDAVLEQVGVDEREGKAIPLDLPFSDADGNRVRLATFFTGGPVILTMNYYACPNLCPLVFRNLAAAVGRMGDLSLGRDFRIVTVSVDPAEKRVLAKEKAKETYAMLAVAEPSRAWPFLLGERSSVEGLAKTAGIRYLRLPDGDFAHPNVLVVLTPAGQISRYLYGLEPEPRDLRLALVEAARGEIGSQRLVNRALLYCFHYDPVGRKYVLIGSRIMTAAMVVLAVVVGVFLAVLWSRESRKPGGKSGPAQT